ncbi:MAG: hypothetical protein IJM50_07420 [Lachnospiraceae bacterium]|nr:hypothetical protein [Lachnospiraceae bacterium]
MSDNRLNDNLKNSLVAAAGDDHVSHAYLFSGEDENESLRIAEAFARALTDSPADILYPEHEKPALFSVDDVRREINATVHIKPYGSRHKVYIVKDAGLMNVQAQNALLKTLEEPPSYVVMLLLAANGGVFLQTILSRCVKVRVYGERGLSQEETEERTEAQDMVRTFLKEVPAKDERSILSFTDFIGKEKASKDAALDSFRGWFRDALIYKTAKDAKLLDKPDDLILIRMLSDHMRFEGIERVLKLIDTTKQRLDANVRADLSFELLLLSIQEEYQEEL